MYGLIFLDALASLLDIAALVTLLFIINFYTQPLTNVHLSFLPDYFLDRGSLLLIAVFLIVFCIKNIFAYAVQRAQYKFVYAVASRLSETKLLQYLEGSYAGYVSVDSSVQIRKISQQPIEFSQHVLAGIQQIFTQSFLILVTVIAILLFDAKLFLFVLLLLVPPVIVVAILIKKRTRSARAHVKKSGEKTLQHIKEALAGYVESNIYDKRSFFTQRYMHYQQQLNKHLSGLQVVQGLPGRVMEVFAVLGFFVLLLISKWSGGAVDVLTIGMFMAAAYKIMPGLVKILNSSGQVHTFDYTIQDLLSKEPAASSEKRADKQVSIRSVEFSNISFSYEQQKIFSGFSYALQEGDFAGISAISGKGKTTLANILLGFVKPAEGAISINGTTVASDSLRQYWPDISYVQQEPFLINDSILTNITLDEKEHDPGKLTSVIKATGLGELIGHHPEGINKYITENGRDISGGQRQRIVMARALYKDAGLIILDEPFNELDSASEHSLLQQFKELAGQGKIIILITHNKESLSFCNKIIALDEA